MNVIIIDNYKGIRKLNADDSYPIGLEDFYNGKRVLDWHINSVKKEKTRFFYIGGYHIEKIINQYNEFTFFYEKDYEVGLENILDILEKQRDNTLIIYGNILNKSYYIDRVLENSKAITIGVSLEVVDERFKEILREEYYHNGVVKINKDQIDNVVSDIKSYIRDDKKYLQWMKDLINSSSPNIDFINSQNTIDIINIKNKLGMSKFILGTKAQTLETLKNLVNKSRILDQLSFTVDEWMNKSDEIYERILKKYINKKIVVRSSSLSEDCFNESNAGRFESYLNIDVMNKALVKNTVQQVIKSYESKDLKNQVLIQEYIENSIMSGVIFTRNLEDSSPYYLINYDDESGRTDTVTGGTSNSIKSKIIIKNKNNMGEKKFEKLLLAVKEIESLIGYDGLDIEFIIDKKNLYIVQVRPIATFENEMVLTDEDVYQEIESLKQYTNNMFGTKNGILGHDTILGNMPDWNPAELIGSTPRPLSLSLYQKLITNGIWSIAREELGYRSLGYQPLVVSLSGKPYVDVRKSFNSLLPKDLNDKIGEKIINYQLEKLRNNQSFHDKVEFNILKTIMDFNFIEYEEELLNNNFLKDEVNIFKKELIKLTNNILSNFDDLFKLQNNRLEHLVKKLEEVNKISKYEYVEIPHVINNLANDCIINGLLPFSILARFAFISISFLKSLENRNIITRNEYNNILLSIPTVASEFRKSNLKLNNNEITKEEFLNKYGHLRPNTYDINSLNYRQGFEIYFADRAEEVTEVYDENRKGIEDIFKAKREEINNLLNENNIECNAEFLKEFIKKSIASREWAKFEFTKNVNKIITLVEQFGEQYNLSRDDMSYISIDKIISLSMNSPSYLLKKELKRECEFNKKKFKLTQLIKLPSLILKSTDIEEFSILNSIPNYITNKMITKEIVEITTQNFKNIDINNKIVLIESADPGYDWIFSYKIRGLITKYGGAASHMSIRCAEFGIPAAIGTGELIFDNIKSSKVIELNCEAKKIKVIK